ncbi:MAG: type II toxin-antitoxin system RelB/DinJ family antitoxin [Candidatus Paceibacterota bacterium]|jgi:addiction module RelB/DinJ family antitoxin
MATNTTIQIRIDEKIKRAVRKTFQEVGLDLSSGIKLFLHNVAITKTVPLQIRTANGFTIDQEKQILRETEEAVKIGPFYSTSEELHSAIFGLSAGKKK